MAGASAVPWSGRVRAEPWPRQRHSQGWLFRRKRWPTARPKRGGADRRRVAAGQPYEVGYFARKHGLSREQAEKIIKQTGGDREKANAAAQKAQR